MNAAVRQIILGRSGINPLSLFAKYNASGLWIPDFNFGRAADSNLSRLYTTSAGVTAVSAVADNIGLVLEESQGAAIVLVLSDDLSDLAGLDWTLGSGWSQGTGATATAATGDLEKSLTTTQGRFYRVRYSISNYSAGDVRFRFTGTANVQGALNSANGTFSEILYASVTNAIVEFVDAGAGFTGEITDLVIEQISGNHAYQATAASRGSLQQVDGRYVWRGDGTADCLLTTLPPAASACMFGGVEFNAVSDKAFGASVGTDLFSAGTDSNGLATAYIGSTVVALSAADVRDIPGVIAMAASGSTYWAFWKPFNGAVESVKEGSFAGAIPTTQNISLGAENDDGTNVAFLAGDAYNFFGGQFRPTAAEGYAIANVMSRAA